VDVIKEQGFEFDKIDLLSGDQVPSLARGKAYSCAEVWAYGTWEDDDQENRMRKEFAEIAEDRGVDIAFQQLTGTSPEDRVKPRLFCFDMDSTLIQGEVIDELAKMAGVADQVVAITASAMRGEIEFQESFRRRVRLLSGLPASRAHELLDRIPLMEGSERLFRKLHAMGAKTAILSGGFTFFGAHLKKRLGIDHVYANQLDIDTDGFVTGEVHGKIVDGARKAELLVEIAAKEGIPLHEVVAVGDGANDLPMLRLAGMGVAFHAKPVVRASAKFSMTHVGLDGLLYLLGIPDWEWVE
jgi:phosphoserine phosphatase